MADRLQAAFASTIPADVPDDDDHGIPHDGHRSQPLLKAGAEATQGLTAALRIDSGKELYNCEPVSEAEMESEEYFWSSTDEEPPIEHSGLGSLSRCHASCEMDFRQATSYREGVAALQLFLTWDIAKSPVWSLAEAALQQGPGKAQLFLTQPFTAQEQQEQAQQDTSSSGCASDGTATRAVVAFGAPDTAATNSSMGPIASSPPPPPLRIPSARSGSSSVSWAAELSPRLLVASSLSPANSMDPSASGSPGPVHHHTESSRRVADPNTGPSGQGAGTTTTITAGVTGPTMAASGPDARVLGGAAAATGPPGKCGAASAATGDAPVDGFVELFARIRSFGSSSSSQSEQGERICKANSNSSICYQRSWSFGCAGQGNMVTDDLSLGALAPIFSGAMPQPAAVPAIPFGMGPLPLRLLPTRKFIDVPCMSEQLHVMRLVVRARQDLRMVIASAASTPSAAASAAVEASRALRRWGSSTERHGEAEAALPQAAAAATSGGGVSDGAAAVTAGSHPSTDSGAADQARTGVLASLNGTASRSVGGDSPAGEGGRELNRSSSLLARVALAVANSLVGPQTSPSARVALGRRVRGVVAAVSLGMAALNLMTAAHTLAGADFHDPAAGCKALVDFALGCPNVNEVTRDLLRIGVAIGLGSAAGGKT